MKTKFISGLVVGALFLGLLILPGRGLAQTSDTTVQALQAQIQTLLALIQQLQAQIAALQGGQVSGQAGGQTQGGSLQQTSGVGPVVSVDPSQKFLLNDRVQSTFDLNVRSTPGGSAVAIVPPHTNGTITSGAQQFGAYWWWKVNYDNGASGYSVGDFLEKVDVLGGEATGNKAPVLSTDAFVSPTSVGVNDSNWWRLEGTDPEGGQITYKVEWGDGTSDTYTLSSGGSAPARHIFSGTGNFQLKLTATDSAGASVSRLISVNVINGPQTLSQPSTKFKVGDVVQTTDNLNVRTGPSGVPSGVQPVGAKATVVGGPAWSIVGGWWWDLRYDSGVSGWSSEDWLTKIGTAPTSLTCGDINADGKIDQADVTALVNHIFSGASVPAGVNPDLNGDGSPDVFDQIALSDYLAGKAAAPTCVAVPVSPNQPPVISSFTGPSSLIVGQSGTWNAFATDPEGGNLFGSVSWGDGSASTTFANIASGGGLVFQHSYASAGTYNVSYFVRDASGASASRVLSVTVTSVSQNMPPVNLSISGPATVTGMPNPFWDFKATDLEGGNLAYSIDWGDGTPIVTRANISSGASWSYLYHTYSSVGTKTIAFTATDNQGASSKITFAVTKGEFACGDVNADGVINMTDVNVLVNYLFSGGSVLPGVKTDLNGDGSSDVFDQIALSNYLGGQGVAPTCGARIGGTPAGAN